MRNGFRLGRILGISIEIDWSWFLIFLLVTWNLAAGVFPSLHPDWGPGLNWLIALAASLLFFASVLAHELAHALVALAQGLPVRRITLFMFGGVSNIEREPPSPATEFLVAIVGPITSLALGVTFQFLGAAVAAGPQLIFGNFGEGLARLSPLATLLLWLGPINILLGLFNLIPGFPLDGGRVLRSILWALTDDLRRATRWASRVGQTVAWLFIINGIAMAFGARLPLFGSGFLSGLWLVFIGLFLNSAAVQSYRQVAIEDLFEGVPVAHLMRPNVPTVSPDLRINQLVDNYVMTTEEQAFPVVENDRLVGLVSVEDIHRVPREVWPTWPVSQIMTPADHIDVVTPRDDVTEAFHKLARRDVRQMPVVQDGHIVGILRHRDIVRWLHLRSGFAAR